MKKAAFLTTTILCTTLFCSCRITASVTKNDTFGNTLKEVAGDLQKEGFYFAGSDNSLSYERNAPGYSLYWNPGAPLDPVTGQENLYPQSGFGFDRKVTYDKVDKATFCFTDKEGDTLVFTVSYKRGDYFVDEVGISGCEVSNPVLQAPLCGDFSPIRKLDQMPKDTIAVFK